MGDYQARFCENAMVKVHSVTRLGVILKKGNERHRRNTNFVSQETIFWI